MLTQEMIAAGDKIVVSWLKSNGYFRVIESAITGHHTEVNADSGMRRILVHIRCNENQMPQKEEIAAIKKRAKESERDAWIAFVQIDNTGGTTGSIDWVNLAKH